MTGISAAGTTSLPGINMSDAALNAIEARHAAATAGAWMGGPEAEAAGQPCPDWGLIWSRQQDGQWPWAAVADCCYGASRQEMDACRAEAFDRRQSGADSVWVEPKQVAANRIFIEAAHNTDIPNLIATVRMLRAALKPFAEGGPAYLLAGGDTGVMRERIVDWLGPSDFEAARRAYGAGSVDAELDTADSSTAPAPSAKRSLPEHIQFHGNHTLALLADSEKDALQSALKAGQAAGLFGDVDFWMADYIGLATDNYGRVVGAISGYTLEGDTPFIQFLHVADHVRRCGIGRRLVDDFRAHFTPSKGPLQAFVMVGNTASESFFQIMGLNPVATLFRMRAADAD